MQKGTPPQALEIIEREMKEQTGTLILSDCGLTEFPREIFEMEWLTELVITNGYYKFKKGKTAAKILGEPNHLSFIPEEIGRLKNLKKLTIGSVGTSPWAIKSITPLVALINLEELVLDGNQIEFIPSLEPLKGLRKLNLFINQIKEIDGISKNFNLVNLVIAKNKINELDLSNFNLQKLSTLHAENNSIRIVKGISHLKSLSLINLSNNQISEIDFLQKNKNLSVLTLAVNSITNLNALKNLINLKNLSLGFNKIENLNPIVNLENLELLSLGHNNISNIEHLKNLTKLHYLDIQSNKIEEIESLKIFQIIKPLVLNLDNNPITDCPPDVYQSNDINQIRAYFESQSRDSKQVKAKTKKKSPQIQESISLTPPATLKLPDFDTSQVDDIKLIFVGNSGAGKTQLSKFFENGKLDKKRETTHGIRLNRWLPSGKASPAFKALKGKVAANVWDFGGQEYYHGTFRLFLSNYAVYILVWEEDTNQNNIFSTEVRENENENLQHYQYKYWLDNIRHYAPTSPILIVQNKTDKDGVKRVDTKWVNDYNIFGDHHISLHEAAAGKNEKYKWSFDLFCNDLAECFVNILNQDTQQKKSIAWLKVRDAVVEVAKTGKKSKNNPFSEHLTSGKYIDLKDFETACKKIEKDFTESELYTLPRWLHNSGVVIFFGEDQQLSDKVYLDPIWVTEGIYKILNNTVRTADGIFTKKDIHPRKGFNKETVLALMMEMEIVFEKTDEPDTYVAPQYLPETHPVEDLYAIAAKGLQQKAYFVRLPLYFFRKVLQRMIFFYGMSANVDARYYWKKGILFEKKGTRVMFKGIMPEPESEYGIFLIGAEPVGAYRDIQKEVFHIITEILEEKDLSKIATPELEEDLSQSKVKNVSARIPSDIYHRSDNWTSIYETAPVPGWLKNMEVSVDGQNFVNYLHLCQENRKESIFINSNLDNRLRIHDFELLLDGKPKRPLKIFFSYSHKDTEIMNQLSVHLAPLKRLEKIEVWSDKAIQAGDEWDSAIKDNLKDADIILFLVSADFIASSYIWNEEIPLAIQYKNDPNEVVSKVIPIYLRPVDFSGLAFAATEMIPKDESGHLKAISQWENIDEAFMEVAKRIREVIEETN